VKSGTIRASKDQVSCVLDGETVILLQSTGKYFGLNEVGSRVWEIVQTPCTFDGIVSRLTDEFAVNREKLELDVDRLLLEMLKAKLIEVSDASAP